MASWLWPDTEGLHSVVMVTPRTTLQPTDVLSIRPGSGIPSVSSQADLRYGSGCAIMHMEAQHDQKHRRSSSACSGGGELALRPLFLWPYAKARQLRYARARKQDD